MTTSSSFYSKLAAASLFVILTGNLGAQIPGGVLQLTSNTPSGTVNLPYQGALGINVTDIFGNFLNGQLSFAYTTNAENQLMITANPSLIADPVAVYQVSVAPAAGGEATAFIVAFISSGATMFFQNGTGLLATEFPNNIITLTSNNGGLAVNAQLGPVPGIAFQSCAATFRIAGVACFATGGGLTRDWLTFDMQPPYTFTTYSAVTISASTAGLAPGLYQGYVMTEDPTGQHVLAFAQVNLLNNLPAVLPHLAVGGSYVTGITVVNTGSSTGNFSISFYGDDGQPVSYPFEGIGSIATLSGTVAAGGEAYYEAGNSGFPLTGGWGIVTADANINVSALFRNLGGNGSYYEASVPEESSGMEVEIPFDATTFLPTGDQIFTGFALANLDPNFAANVTCVARNALGTPIANAITVPQLAPLGHWANYLFPALNGSRGTIDCTSDTVISAVGLRFLGDNAFSSLPVIFP